MSIEHAELRKLAEAAEAEPKIRAIGYGPVFTNAKGPSPYAAFRTAANPATVLQLLDRIANLEAQLEDVRDFITTYEHRDSWNVECVYTERLRVILGMGESS